LLLLLFLFLFSGWNEEQLLCGLILTVVGAWVRVGGLGPSTFWIGVIGQTLAAIGQPFILNAPPKVASNWFPDGERTIATTLCSLANPLGVAFGFLLPTIVVSKASELTNLLIIEAGITTIFGVFIGLFVQDAPPSPPSSSQSSFHHHDMQPTLMKATKLLFTDLHYLLLFVVFGLGLGAFNTVATVLNQLLVPFDYGDFNSSVIGALLILFGIIGSGIAGAVVDRTQAFKIVLLCSLTGGVISMVLLAIFLKPDDFAILCVVSAFIGFTMTPVLPLSLELATEISYPIGEATACGFLMTNGQIFGIIMILIVDWLLKTGKEESPQAERTHIKWCVWTLTGCMAFSLLLMVFFKAELKRSVYEKSKKATI